MIFDGDESECQAFGQMNASCNQVKDAENQMDLGMDGQVGADERLDETYRKESSLEESMNKLDELLQRLVLKPIGEEDKKNLKETASKCSQMMDQLVRIVDPIDQPIEQEPGRLLIFS